MTELVIVALLAVWAFAAVLGPDSRSLAAQAYPDGAQYADSAYRFAHGDGYTTTVVDRPGYPPVNPPRYPPGYPLLLAPFTLIGDYPANVLLGGKLLGASLVAAMGWAALRFGGLIGAGVVFAVCATSPFYADAGVWLLSDAVSATTANINSTDCAELEPRSRFTTPSRYTLTTSVSVALPGPPPVSAWTVPKVSKAA